MEKNKQVSDSCVMKEPDQPTINGFTIAVT